MPMTNPDLESFLVALGDATIFVGDPFTADGLEELGAKQGDVSINFNQEFNNLTFPEHTGPAIHEASLQGENPVINLPMIIGNPDLWEKLSATGTTGGGFKSPQPVQETSLVIVPSRELVALTGIQSFAYPAPSGPWTAPPGAPVNWIWFWRGYFLRPDITFSNPDLGRSVTGAQFQTLWYSPNPDGHKLYTIGDPIPQGITLVRV